MELTPRSYAYYLMAKPPPDVAAALYGCGTGVLRNGGERVRLDRLHFTMLELGRRVVPDPTLIETVKEMLEGFDCTPMRLVVEEIVGGKRGNLFLQPSEPLRGFARVREALVRQSSGTLAIYAKPKPHVTLGYDIRPFAALPINPVSWVQEEILLIESHVGASRHFVHGRWRLSAGDSRCRAA